MRTKFLVCFFFLSSLILGQNAIIVVIDGARYSETFGSDGKYIPHMYNDLAPLGTVFTNFRIAGEGLTSTNPGQASILTGTWQVIENDGSERPNKPTIFEYFRKQLSVKATDCFIVAGKKKLEALSYSTFPGYGSNYGASTNCFDGNDDEVYDSLVHIMNTYQPKLIFINFPTTDIKGHSGVWNDYVNSLTEADRLVYLLWQKIQNNPYYKNSTTMFVTNDHGRHTDNFNDHGDKCDGCQHIMLLAVGKNIPEGVINSELHRQIDIAGTVGKLLGFKVPFTEGVELFNNDKINSSSKQ
ncbi:MAG: sulfatase-like hydrolase/transferase [Ignavibacteriaceae bacterium]